MVWSQVRPPNLSPDNLPDTAFTCEDKVTGGYYADVEADCQLFHVCVQVSEYEVSRWILWKENTVSWKIDKVLESIIEGGYCSDFLGQKQPNFLSPSNGDVNFISSWAFLCINS